MQSLEAQMASDPHLRFRILTNGAGDVAREAGRYKDRDWSMQNSMAIWLEW
jgi:hypothetical protein